jgi:hypothetical protein
MELVLNRPILVQAKNLVQIDSISHPLLRLRLQKQSKVIINRLMQRMKSARTFECGEIMWDAYFVCNKGICPLEKSDGEHIDRCRS